MVIINSRHEIDFNLLNKHFEKRGHSIINPTFLEQIDTILTKKDLTQTVFQCTCGEVFFLKNDNIPSVQDLNTLLCAKCDPSKYESGIIYNFKERKNYEQIITLTEKFIKQKITFDELLVEVNKIDLTLFNAKTPREYFYQMHKYNMSFFNFFPNKDYVNLFSELISLSKKNKHFYDLFKKTCTNINSEKNIQRIQIANEEATTNRNILLFYGITPTIDLKKDKNTTKEELEIQNRLNLYNHLVEEKQTLNLLFNLVRLAEGLSLETEPFKNEKIKIKNKYRSVDNKLYNKIQAFNNYSRGKPLYFMLNNIYKTRIRNAHAHNEYYIDLTSEQVFCKENISFDSLKELINDLNELKNTLYLLLQEEYYKMNPVIREVGLGYDELIIKEDKLLPKSIHTLPEIFIKGYNLSEKNKPRYVIDLLNNGDLKISIGREEFLFPLDGSLKTWLKQIRNTHGKLIISFHNIKGFENINNKDIALTDFVHQIEYIDKQITFKINKFIK